MIAFAVLPSVHIGRAYPTGEKVARYHGANYYVPISTYVESYLYIIIVPILSIVFLCCENISYFAKNDIKSTENAKV